MRRVFGKTKKGVLLPLPIVFNIVCSLVCKWNAEKLFFLLERDERLMRDGELYYCIGTGSVLLVIMLALLLVSIGWICMNAKIVYNDKDSAHKYKVWSIGFVVFMDVCWIIHYLDLYSLIGVIQILPEPPM